MEIEKIDPNGLLVMANIRDTKGRMIKKRALSTTGSLSSTMAFCFTGSY